MIGHSVDVTTLERGKPGIETGRRFADADDPNVARHDPAKSAFDDSWVAVNVDVGDLAASVNAGVGAPRAGQLRLFAEPKDGAERGLEFTLDGSQARLGRPAVKVGSVVGQVDPHAHCYTVAVE